MGSVVGIRRRYTGNVNNSAGQTFGRPSQPVKLASICVQLADATSSFAMGQVYGSLAEPASLNEGKGGMPRLGRWSAHRRLA